MNERDAAAPQPDRGDSSASPRPLHTSEKAILDLLLAADFPGAEGLRTQAQHVRAAGDGLFIELVPCVDDPSAPVTSRTPAQATVSGQGFDGGVILFVDDGRLSALEYWWVTDEMPDEWPPLSAVRAPKP